MPRRSFYLGVFLLTAAALMLQLVQTRILSVVAWYHLAFFVISLAMFGLTAGSVWVYLRGERFGGASLSADLSRATAAFALSAAGLFAVQTTLAPVVVLSLAAMVVWLELALCLAVPFFFAGVAVSLALTRSPFPVGRVYGVDMLGAATGCLLTPALLSVADGPSALLWVSALAAAGAACFARSGLGGTPPLRWRPARVLDRPGALAAGLAACALANGLTDHGLRPIAVKGRLESTEDALYEAWNSFSRVSVAPSYRKPPQMWGASPRTPAFLVEERRLSIDGDVGTTTYRFDGRRSSVAFLEYDVTNLAYFLPGRESAAIIGVGGGRDVLSAWYFGLRDVTGVEVNPIFVDLLTGENGHADFANLRDLAGVRFVVDEARSWFARSRRQFDLIQMSLTDTWAATGAGAFTLSENALYTEQGWRIFFDRLTPRGAFTVSRWYSPGDVNETGRLVSLATAVLLAAGAREPARHVFLASSGRLATLVVGRSPFAPADVAALESAARRLEFRVLASPGAPVASPVLGRILGAPDRQALFRYTGSLALDLTPPSDDRPFFFNQLPFRDLVGIARITRSLVGQSTARGGVTRGNLVATGTLLLLFLVATVLVVASIAVPLQPALRDAGERLVFAGTAYFALIGVGFMAVEIGLLQRLSVFLGRPIYALAVVLFTLVLSTGLGSLLSDRLPLATPGRFAAWALSTVGYLSGLPLWLPALLAAHEGDALLARAALCVLVIAPAGGLLGFGFPTGMRLVSAVDARPTPWFFGINGAAGTLAAIACVATSIAYGIAVTLWIGAACYALLVPAAWAIGFGSRAGSAPGAPRGG